MPFPWVAAGFAGAAAQGVWALVRGGSLWGEWVRGAAGGVATAWFGRAAFERTLTHFGVSRGTEIRDHLTVETAKRGRPAGPSPAPSTARDRY